MIIDNVRLPIDVEQGVKGGPQFNTTINMTDGGHIIANQNWEYPLYVGNVGYGIQDRDDLEAVIEFFYARRGRLRGFLFRDWSDYQFTNENLGTGDGVERNFQCIRTYSDTVLPFVRPLKYPIESSMTVYNNGVAVNGSQWSLLSTGEVRFTTAPALGEVITATGEFNIAARFLTDTLEIDMLLFSTGSIPAIPIAEVRE
jgi:uncharacterized protein (TIGR02217 family)